MKIFKIGLSVVVATSVLSAGGVHLYDVKSGKITYEIKGAGEVMGSKIQTVGKKRVIFDNNGAKNLTEENKIDKQIIMKKAKINKSHTMTYMKKGAIYRIDFKRKRIMRMANISAVIGAKGDMKQAGEAMLKKMGGKKIGTDKVLGYSCDVWDLMGVKQCIYKGVPLRVESNVMGIKNIEVATEAKFDISLSKDDFKMPDFPIYDMQGNKLDRAKLEAMDKKAEADAQQASKDMAITREAMAKASKDAGVQKGKRPTKAQAKAMEASMMNAMLPRMKKRMLSQKEALVFGKKCLSDAGTLKEARKCAQKMDKMSGEASDPEDEFKEWNPKTKKEVLGFIDQGLEGINCVQKAKNMQEMKQCMSKGR